MMTFSYVIYLCSVRLKLFRVTAVVFSFPKCYSVTLLCYLSVFHPVVSTLRRFDVLFYRVMQQSFSEKCFSGCAVLLCSVTKSHRDGGESQKPTGLDYTWQVLILAARRRER